MNRGVSRAATWRFISRFAFALSVIFAFMSPSWERGAFSLVPLGTLKVGTRTYRPGILIFLPLTAAASWMIVRILDGHLKRPPWHALAPPLLFGTWALLRCWPVHLPHVAFTAIASILVFWATCVYAWLDWPQTWLIGALATILLIQGTVAIAQFLLQRSVGITWLGESHLDPAAQGISVIETQGKRWLRAYGLTPHPNLLGGYLALSLLICLGWLWQSRGSALWGRLALCLALTIGGLGLLVSFSRSAWLAMSVGSIYLALRLRPWRPRNSRKGCQRMVLVVGLALAAIALIWTNGLVAQRLLHLNTRLEQMSLRERWEDIGQALVLIRAQPLRGVGTGYYIAALWAAIGNRMPTGYPGFRIVHNAFLLATAELGIVGGGLWLWLLGEPLLSTRTRSSRGHPIDDLNLKSAFLGAFILSLFDNYLYLPATWWPALFLGILYGSWLHTKYQTRDTD